MNGITLFLGLVGLLALMKALAVFYNERDYRWLHDHPEAVPREEIEDVPLRELAGK